MIQLHTTSEEDLLEQSFQSARNGQDGAFMKKPARGTGFWTSTFREETQDSAWVEWCQGNMYSNPYKQNWHLLIPKDDVKLYVIDSIEDFHRLLRDFGYEDEKMKSYGFIRTNIDFERMCQEYDGIHLTEQGNEETHLSYPDDLNAWDCESTLWLRWCFSEVHRIEVPQPVEIGE